MGYTTDQVDYIEHISDVFFRITLFITKDLCCYIYVTLGISGKHIPYLKISKPDSFLLLGNIKLPFICISTTYIKAVTLIARFNIKFFFSFALLKKICQLHQNK